MWAHGRQFRFADKELRLVAQRQGEDNRVARCEEGMQFVQVVESLWNAAIRVTSTQRRPPIEGGRMPTPFGGENMHPTGCGEPCNFASNRSKANNAERFPANFRCYKRFELLTAGPLCPLLQTIGQRQAMSMGQQHGQDILGDLHRVYAVRASNGNIALPERRIVQEIDARAVYLHPAQFGCQAHIKGGCMSIEYFCLG